MDHSSFLTVTEFGRDQTVRWSCRGGDFVLWFSAGNLMDLLSDDKPYTIADFWELRHGDYVTISNRPADFPYWLELQPDELSSALAKQMPGPGKTRGAGRVRDAPNLWRAKAGDRVAWVDVSGAAQVLDLSECALVVGQSCADPYEGRHVSGENLEPDGLTGVVDTMVFGAPAVDEYPPEVLLPVQRVVGIVQSMPLPRSVATRWKVR